MATTETDRPVQPGMSIYLVWTHWQTEHVAVWAYSAIDARMYMRDTRGWPYLDTAAEPLPQHV